MAEFFPEIDVSDAQADGIARGLYAVARADGDLHPQERAIIQEFYAGGHDHAASLNALERAGVIEPDVLAAILGSPEVQRLFLKTALLCAWADGRYSDDEKALVGSYASACGVSDEELEELEAMVKEFMLAQLAHLKNVDATVEVKRELDL